MGRNYVHNLFVFLFEDRDTAKCQGTSHYFLCVAFLTWFLRKVMDIFRRYDETMQPGGIDEAYLKYASIIFLMSLPDYMPFLVSQSIARSTV